MPGVGFEPTRPFGQSGLGRLRLTVFRHPGPEKFMAQLPRCYGVPAAGTRLEASALQHTARLPALAGRSPLLRLQSDERLVALIRRGHHGAFEALVPRYQPRLPAFCRPMLASPADPAH